jgi:DNA-binding transcriptional ArsR family regulator
MVSALQAVSSPRRREILRLVWDRERPAGEIADAMPEVTFGAISQHLRVLEEAGLLERREEGRRRYYAARPEALGPLKPWLESMWEGALSRLKERAEMEAARRGPKSARARKTRKKRDLS